MDWNMIDATGVDIDRLAQVLHSHGTTLNVPAGEPESPWTLPFHLALTLFNRELPKSEVRRIALLAIEFDTSPGLHAIDIKPGQVSIAVELRSVKVDTVGSGVGTTSRLDLFNEIDLVLNVVG